MKKVKIILSAIILMSIVLYGAYRLFFERTPERLIEWNFNISLKGFDYTVESFEEQWCPNGDGQILIIIKFKELTPENINYLEKFNPQRLPISKTDLLQMSANSIPNQYRYADTGYYIYKLDDPAINTDFKILIVDIAKKTAVYYYQIM